MAKPNTSDLISPEEKAKAKSNREAHQFETALRKALQRYNTKEFSILAAQRIWNVMYKPDEWARTPVHFLVQAIEANYVYYRDSYKQYPVDSMALQKVMALCSAYHDPYENFLLSNEKDLGLWVLATGKKQFPYQKRPRYTLVGRAMLLFVEGCPLRTTTTLFREQYELSMSNWIYLCVSVYALSSINEYPVITLDPLKNSSIPELPKEALDAFMDRVAISPSGIREEYVKLRRKYPQFLHGRLPSVLEVHPVINHENGTYVVVHPGWMFNLCLEGLYDACKSINGDEFTQEFGESFERYVGSLLNEVSDKCTVFAEPDLQRVCPGKTCDFVVQFNSCILLVECKAARYAATLPTDEAISKDNSTSKLADSIIQIDAIARRVLEGRYDGLLSGDNRQMIGVTVTFGTIEFANSPNYLNRYVIPRTEFSNIEDLCPPLHFVPQVISIGDFEDLIVILQNTDYSFAELLLDKLADERESVGDWSGYIYKRFGNDVTEWGLRLTREIENEFLKLNQQI